MATVEQPEQPPTALDVAVMFVQQYYSVLHQSPDHLYKFYQDCSKLSRPRDDGSMSTTTTMKDIDEKIMSLDYDGCKVKLAAIDGQESREAGVHVLVTGLLTRKDNIARTFTQSFFLAPQERGYYVLNDMFMYFDNAVPQSGSLSPVDDVDVTLTSEQEPSPVASDQTSVLEGEANGKDAHLTSENGEVPAVEVPAVEVPVVEVPVMEVSVVEKEVLVAKVIDDVQDKKPVAEPDTKVEEVPKKTFASIVKILKETGAAFSSPAPAVRKLPPKSREQQVKSSLPASAAEVPLSSSDAVENGNNQEGEGEGYAIYVKGLPMNATPALLEEEFKKFGPIKSGGIQVRSNRGFCFGFVKYEVESAVKSALEASPITISGGRQIAVEEKRSTNSRSVNGKGRFANGGFRNDGPNGGFRNDGPNGGFHNDGMRGGRGGYGGGRGGNYGRGDFAARSEFVNPRRGGSSSNRGGGGDGYHRAENMGGVRVNRNGNNAIAANGTAKDLPPRVPATA